MYCIDEISAQWHSDWKQIGYSVHKVVQFPMLVSKPSFCCSIVRCCSKARIAACRSLENIAVNIALGEISVNHRQVRGLKNRP